MKKLFLLFIICFISAACSLKGAGLSTTFVEVLVENLKPGNVYSLKNSVNYPYKIMNKGQKAIDISIKALISDKQYLRKKFENIPDLNWIRFEPSDLHLEPGEEKEADIIITLPDKKEYYDHRYQVNIHTEAKGETGFSVALGVESVLLFTTVAEGVQVNGLSESIDLNYQMLPNRLLISNFTLTAEQRLVSPEQTIKIINQSQQKETYGIKVLKVEETLASVNKGYQDLPDTGMIELKTEELIIDKQSEGEIKFRINSPAIPEFAGQKYQFFIYTWLKNKNDKSGIYSKVFFDLKNK